jgi:hypothetical protein
MITAKERQDFLETIPIFAGLNTSKRLAQDGAAVLVHYSVSRGRAEGVANATGLSQADVSIQLERLVDCGCVRPNRTAHSLLYKLNPPGLLQLEAVVDEFLQASFKAPEVLS